MGEEFPTHDRLAALFLFADDLQQDSAGDIFAGLLVDDDEIDFLEHQTPDISQGDVTAFLRVVQPAIRVLLELSHASLPSVISSGWAGSG